MRVSLELAAAHRGQLGRARYCLGEAQVVPHDAQRELLAVRRRASVAYYSSRRSDWAFRGRDYCAPGRERE